MFHIGLNGQWDFPGLPHLALVESFGVAGGLLISLRLEDLEGGEREAARSGVEGDELPWFGFTCRMPTETAPFFVIAHGRAL
jgi:hypothetical protein